MSDAPILTSPEGQGGIVAQDGFDYQIYYGLLKVAHWLADPTFEGVMFEALEDFEGRFFAPHSLQGHLLERVQAKSSSGLKRQDILDILDKFVAFEKAYPDTMRRFELATPQFPATMQWVHKDLERIRFAGPFYAPFRQVVDASDRAVRDELINDLGEARGKLLFSTGTIGLHPDVPPYAAYAMFAGAFAKTFPSAPHVTQAVFDELLKVARASTKTFLTRSKILDVLEAGLNVTLRSTEPPCLYVIGNRPGAVPDDAIVMDAAFLSGEGRFSPPELWEQTFVAPLNRIKAKWQSEGHRRAVIDGSYRLTAAFAVGAIFNAASGFDLDMQTKDGVWRTNDHAGRGTLAPEWETTRAEALTGDALNVAIGVLRDPSEALTASGVVQETVIRAFLPEAVTSGQQLQALVAKLKGLIGADIARLCAKRVNLYFAGPAPMAMALGHRWNALATAQFHEFDVMSGQYFPTVRF